jgi:hypothetical protein
LFWAWSRAIFAFIFIFVAPREPMGGVFFFFWLGAFTFLGIGR